MLYALHLGIQAIDIVIAHDDLPMHSALNLLSVVVAVGSTQSPFLYWHSPCPWSIPWTASSTRIISSGRHSLNCIRGSPASPKHRLAFFVPILKRNYIIKVNSSAIWNLKIGPSYTLYTCKGQCFNKKISLIKDICIWPAPLLRKEPVASLILLQLCEHHLFYDWHCNSISCRHPTQ